MEIKVLQDKSSKNFERVFGYQVTTARYKMYACAVRDVLSMFTSMLQTDGKKRTHTHPAVSVSILLAVGNFVLNFIFILALTLSHDIKFSKIIVFTRPDSRRRIGKRGRRMVTLCPPSLMFRVIFTMCIVDKID